MIIIFNLLITKKNLIILFTSNSNKLIKKNVIFQIKEGGQIKNKIRLFWLT